MSDTTTSKASSRASIEKTQNKYIKYYFIAIVPVVILFILAYVVFKYRRFKKAEREKAETEEEERRVKQTMDSQVTGVIERDMERKE